DLTVGALGNTAFTAADFAFATASGVIRDAANNSTVAFNAKAITDGQVPTLVSAQYLDVGGNGAVETIRTTWSEAVTMNGSGAADWTITAGSISAVFSAAGNDAAAGTTLDVTVTADANETSSATAPTIAYDNDDANGSVTDGTNVAGTNAAVTLTDGAGPIIVSASATTPSPNNILVNFSETISRAQLLAGDFTVADDASNDLGTTTVVAVGVDGTGTDAIVVITGPIGFSNVGTDTIRFSAAGVVVDSSAGLNASVQVATVPITISRVQSSGGGSNPPASPPPATPTPPPAATPPPPVVPDVKKEEEKKDEVKKDDIKKDEGKKEEGKKDDKKKEPSKTPFKDIVGHLAEAAIAMLWEQKIVTGKTAVLFKPNDTLLRDEMIKWVVLAFKIDVPKTITQKPFKDVSPKDKYAPYISAAVSKKILTGKRSSELQPKKPVTRGEVLKAILIAAGVNVSKESTSDFKDVPVKNALNPYVAYAVKNGIVEVKGKSFGPNVRVTRAEVVMMIVKALEL
ncbi:S-layer homology domain-containing protein, partial [Candidatus Peregrinibacteria bacterium]|nr:S-layer homology domain-containing protein [Candidatus Peregrinibacteria bacterium]